MGNMTGTVEALAPGEAPSTPRKKSISIIAVEVAARAMREARCKGLEPEDLPHLAADRIAESATPEELAAIAEVIGLMKGCMVGLADDDRQYIGLEGPATVEDVQRLAEYYSNDVYGKFDRGRSAREEDGRIYPSEPQVLMHFVDCPGQLYPVLSDGPEGQPHHEAENLLRMIATGYAFAPDTAGPIAIPVTPADTLLFGIYLTVLRHFLEPLVQAYIAAFRGSE